MCSSVEPSTSPFVQISQVEEEKKEIEHLKLRLLHTFFSLFVYVNFFVSFGFLNRSIFRSICVWFFSRPTVFLLLSSFIFLKASDENSLICIRTHEEHCERRSKHKQQQQ